LGKNRFYVREKVEDEKKGKKRRPNVFYKIKDLIK